MSSQLYLSLSEQEKLIARFNEMKSKTPIRKRLNLDFGSGISYMSALTCGVVSLNAAYKGFNYHKFGRFRITTFMFPVIFSVNAMVLHSHFVRVPVLSTYREENPMHYAVRSLIYHQVGLLSASLGTIGATFALGQRFGLIPIPHNFMHAEVRAVLYKYLYVTFKPYRRVVGATWLITSLLMFAVGYREYAESRELLSYMNRKTITMKED